MFTTHDVLLLTGYWPVVGTSVAIALRRRLCLIVPEDEKGLARQGWADEVIAFHPGALDTITTAAQALRDPFQAVTKELSSRRCRIGLEQGETTEPASYAAIHLYRRWIQQLLEQTLPFFVMDSADDVLAQLRSVKTSDETVRIKTACKLAERAFRQGVGQLRAGTTELEAAHFLSRYAQHRAYGFSRCRARGRVCPLLLMNSRVGWPINRYCYFHI